jgi:starch synthase (maltosyl-transferring)
MGARLGIDDVSPIVSHGRYPAKAVVGEHLPVRATVWREGHEALGATLVVWPPGQTQVYRIPMVRYDDGEDRWQAVLVPDRLGEWRFRVEAWDDPWSTWRHAVTVKLAAGQSVAELAADLATGAELVNQATGRWSGLDRVVLAAAARDLHDGDLPVAARTAGALSDAVDALMRARPIRRLLSRGPAYRLQVEREVARSGAWYELFPRSTGGWDGTGEPVPGTLATTLPALDRIAAMGFDVVYLPPIHPIGRTNRKGRNNAVRAAAGDIGSPWAVGGAAGGHDAIDPGLGTIDDFDRLVRRAGELGLEIALDLALQCSPDHPWVTEHPEWFTTRPDGSIAYAENPPKKYQDIYPLNFDNDPAGLRAAVLRVVRFWIGHGIRLFRVDNPHTKPLNFWTALLAEVRRDHPDVVFLAEAFTRPAMMHGLARLGFSQSYTYFTWRTDKDEITGYLEELAAGDALRPNLWTNTPDILPRHLAGAPPAMFAIRAALAALLGPSWGVYSGFELFENTPLAPDGEEYLDSEKYQLRPRDYAGALCAGRSLEPWLTRLNRLRRAHPALRQLRTLRFHDIDNEHLIAFTKTDPASTDAVLCVVSLDPDKPQEGRLRLDRSALGGPSGPLTVHDELTGGRAVWPTDPVLRIQPERAVAAVFSLEPK